MTGLEGMTSEDFGSVEPAVSFEYIGFKLANKDDCFIGGGGSFHCWKWKEPSKQKHHCYRRVEELKL